MCKALGGDPLPTPSPDCSLVASGAGPVGQQGREPKTRQREAHGGAWLRPVHVARGTRDCEHGSWGRSSCPLGASRRCPPEPCAHGRAAPTLAGDGERAVHRDQGLLLLGVAPRMLSGTGAMVLSLGAVAAGSCPSAAQASKRGRGTLSWGHGGKTAGGGGGGSPGRKPRSGLQCTISAYCTTEPRTGGLGPLPGL